MKRTFFVLLLSLSAVFLFADGFPFGAEVMTLNGPMAIEKVRVGQDVVSIDFGTDGKACFRSGRVLQVFENTDAIFTLYTDKGKLVTTSGHQVLVLDGTSAPLGWFEAQFVELGSMIGWMENGKIVGATVKSVTRGNRSMRVYNIEVDNFHTYIADGFVVHNRGQ